MQAQTEHLFGNNKGGMAVCVSSVCRVPVRPAAPTRPSNRRERCARGVIRLSLTNTTTTSTATSFALNASKNADVSVRESERRVCEKVNASYQPLTAAGAALKENWKPCVEWSRRLQDLRDEIKDVEGRPEEMPLRNEQRELGMALENLRAEVRERIAATPTLNSNERRILRLRYLCADPWEAIALQVGRETSAVYTAYRKALNKAATSPLQQAS